ncbi:MAG: GntR family transcriptional regulator [Microlunatus sp.]
MITLADVAAPWLAPPGRSATDVGRRQLSDVAAAYLRDMIMAGELRPGTSVRAETVAEALDISTTPAREALQALRVEGFVRLQPRRGFLVADLTGADISDLFTVQSLIAGELAARAAKAVTDSDLRELDALHLELVAAAARGDHAELEETNHAFHRRINLLVDAPKIIWVLGLLTRYVPRRFYATIEGWPAATVDDHAELLAGLHARDPQRTRRAMADHIMHAGTLLAAHFDERTGPQSAIP